MSRVVETALGLLLLAICVLAWFALALLAGWAGAV